MWSLYRQECRRQKELFMLYFDFIILKKLLNRFKKNIRRRKIWN